MFWQKAWALELRIEIVREPGEQRHLVLARAGLGDHLLLLAGEQLHLDADRREIRLDRLRDIGIGRLGEVIERDGEAVGIARLGQERLRLGDVLLEGIVGERPRDALGQEGLPDAPEIGRDVLGDRLVVDRLLDRLVHLHLLELRHAWFIAIYIEVTCGDP